MIKKWKLESKNKIDNSKFNADNLIKILLKNRGVTEKKEIKEFLNPDLSTVTTDSVKISKKELKKALVRIAKALKEKQKIIIYGDYDVDGICASAILWETLNSLKADVMPYIPSRFDEGYGLSKEGIDALLKSQNVDLIITVDNGIVANDAVEYAKTKGIDVIITDHHLPSIKLPQALAIVHTTLLCGAGVAYMLSQEIKKNGNNDHLGLVALATVADLVPLLNANRIFVYFGIKILQKTKREGLLVLIKHAGLAKENIGVYEIGHIIAPRLNAMGRLENAMDSLRLICTNDKERAEKLSFLLTKTNFERQQITTDALAHAKNHVSKKSLKKLIFIADESYQQGIVGLVAGRLVEEYYLPSIVISKGEKFSKASARSVKGFNIVEFIRTASDLLVDVGGHPMAAGFTVATDNISKLETKLLQAAEKLVKNEHLERTLRIDTELPIEFINLDNYQKLQVLSPFGMANPEPTFLTRGLIISSLRLVGNDGKHLKINFQDTESSKITSGIYFGVGNNHKLSIGDKVNVVYAMNENVWNGSKTLELKIKDISKN